MRGTLNALRPDTGRRRAGGEGGAGAIRPELRLDVHLVAAAAVCVGVAVAVLVTLWDKLTMPFWFNEQWRAFYVSDPGDWWTALRSDGAPFPAGWFFLERASSYVFGSTELTLRLPTALFLPASALLLLLLARRWMPLIPAVVVSLLGSLVGSILVFTVQLSEYGIDAAAAVAVILFHQAASDGATGRRLHLAYAGMAGACILSTPAIFLAGPLLLLDLIRALRGGSLAPRRVYPHAVDAVLAGAVILAHLGLFVLRQDALRHSGYWNSQFMPHHGLVRQLRFIGDGLKPFVTSAFTGGYSPKYPILLGLYWSWAVTVPFTLLLVVGVAHLTRSARGRSVPFAVVGAFVLTLVASYLRYWPFGFVRTNLYLLPVLVFIAGVGAARAGAYAAAAVRWVRPGGTAGSGGSGGPGGSGGSGRLLPDGSSRGTHVVTSAAAGALVVLMVAGAGLAAVYDFGAYRQVSDSAQTPGYGAGIRAAVAAVRSRAVPGAAVVVSGYMAQAGWTYYQYEYSGRATRTGPQIPRSRAVITAGHGDAAITRMVRRYRPPEIFLYVPSGTTQGGVHLDLVAIVAGEPCRRVPAPAVTSGGLYRLDCRA